jgi:hypothetical protein
LWNNTIQGFNFYKSFSYMQILVGLFVF